ncbi:MAG: NAD-dependent epimerase/dehydratase family protein [Bauldia sp.]|nr:NAD-dependent epimerase/dehydratase family protein [Bauldia sp.]
MTAETLSPARHAEPAGPLFDGPVLVTGATGFLGQYVVRKLLALRQPVIATGRNLKIGLALQAEGADFRPVDLTDLPGLRAAMTGVTAVVHAGALSSAWGKESEFHATNVGGTENVITAALAAGAKRLVYVSSPSVMTRHAEQLNLKESDPLPDGHVSVYSLTKRLGEDRVRAASNRIETVILRPKAIYGVGDTAIFPRLLKAAAKGRLPIIGDGNTITNLTHVSDVVEAILLALKSDRAVGNAYVITGGEDVRIWDVIRNIVERSGFKAPTRKLPLRRAMRVATVLEAAWKRLHLPGEPPLTKYTAGILGLSQTYDITAARRDLGYEPKVPIARGVEESFSAGLAAFRGEGKDAPARPTAPARPPRPVGVKVLNSGTAWVRGWYFYPHSASIRWTGVPATFALIDHPDQGLVLWDTGYAPRYYEATRRFPWRIMRYLTPATITQEQSAVAQLGRMGIRAEDIDQIVLSHFDPDHFGGLRDFPKARVLTSWRGWEAARSVHGLHAVRARILPNHLPDDLAGRLHLLPDPDGPPISVFEASLDLFGDGSIRLVALPGHAPGQFGAFVRRQSDNADLFLAADGCWNLAAIEANRYRGGAHRWLAVDKRVQDATTDRLRRMHREWPELQIVPAHCPRAWREVGEPEENVTV